jgi:hypothetical protein
MLIGIAFYFPDVGLSTRKQNTGEVILQIHMYVSLKQLIVG